MVAIGTHFIFSMKNGAYPYRVQLTENDVTGTAPIEVPNKRLVQCEVQSRRVTWAARLLEVFPRAVTTLPE